MNPNQPDRFELLDIEGDIKFKEEPESKIKNASTFIIAKEDHTIGNILRTQLLKNKDVLFAGYRVPHPLNHEVEIKVQTTDASSPKEALAGSISELQHLLRNLENQFIKQVEKHVHRDRVDDW